MKYFNNGVYLMKMKWVIQHSVNIFIIIIIPWNTTNGNSPLLLHFIAPNSLIS